MKQLVSISFNRYLFWRISKTASLKHGISQYGRSFSTSKAIKASPEVFSKPVLDSKKQKNINVIRGFSSNTQESFDLMDFDVWIHPSFFQFVKDFYNIHCVARELDSFSVSEFTSCSAKALQLVTTLLSELRFPELEGLITQECEEQVRRNLERWDKTQLSVLSLKPENLVSCFPCDVSILSDDKKFVQMRVIYYVWLEYCGRFDNKGHNPLHDRVLQLQEHNTSDRKLQMGAVYNCLFITEVTERITAQWMINKINLRCFPNLFLRF